MLQATDLFSRCHTPGVCILELSKDRFDEGKILKRTEIKVESTWTFNQLMARLGQVGADDVITVLSDYNNFVENAKPQSFFPEQASKAPKRQMLLWNQVAHIYVLRHIIHPTVHKL